MERDVGEKCNNIVGTGGGNIKRRTTKKDRTKYCTMCHVLLKHLNQVKNQNL
jgi:hypothetical protein